MLASANGRPRAQRPKTARIAAATRKQRVPNRLTNRRRTGSKNRFNPPIAFVPDVHPFEGVFASGIAVVANFRLQQCLVRRSHSRGSRELERGLDSTFLVGKKPAPDTN